MTDEEVIELDKLLLFEEAEEHLWDFCHLLEPDFYREDRPHLTILCSTLEKFYYNKLLKPDGTAYHKLMLRLPPQSGKSRTLVNFTKWVLGKDNEERIITASHTDAQASDFSRYTRDGISEGKNIESQIVYSDIFPGTKIKQGNASFQKWALEGQHFNYLGVGVGGGVTGKGATIRIMDDLIKDAEMALSDTALSKIWVWLSGTFSSRNAAKGGDVKEIFCATIWGEQDPQVILEKTEPGEWYILSMPVYNASTDKMLCPDILSKEQYLKLKHRMEVDSRTKMIFQANYHCVALSDDETKVFPVSSLKRYKEFPPDDVAYFTLGQVDPADEGTDSFACPIGRVYTGLNRVYIFDAIFESTLGLSTYLPMVQDKVKIHKITHLAVETNTFGAWFAHHCRELMPALEVFGLKARKNKMGRILANAGLVKLFFYFPENPNPDLQRFMNQLCKLMKTSTKEDDAADSVAGMAAYLEHYFGMFKNDETEEKRSPQPEYVKSMLEKYAEYERNGPIIHKH